MRWRNTARGPYAGCVGYIGFDGSLDMAITIRTAVFDGRRARLQAGAGIVYDSVPEREHDEVMNKLLVLMKAGGTRMIALIDNYDSFTFNVYDYLARHTEVRVFRNTESLDRMKASRPAGHRHLARSLPSGQLHAEPRGDRLFQGTGCPSSASASACRPSATTSERTVRRARSVMHGKVDVMDHSGGTLFEGIDREFSAVRYHSLVVECDDKDLTVCAVSKSDGEVMAIEHKEAHDIRPSVSS